MRDILKRIRDASHELGGRELTPAQKSEIEKLEALFTQRDEPTPDALTISDLEDQIDSLVAESWTERSYGSSRPTWRDGAFNLTVLESLFAILDEETARAALVRIAASVEVANLLKEIESSTSRISDLVGAIKEYTFMDQSPVQNVDVVKSLETTLTILNYKLKRGITVRRDYQRVSASGQFVRQRAQSGLDKHDRQCHRRHERREASFACAPIAITAV